MALSVDPYMRCRFFESGTGVDYVETFKKGEPITSAGIGRVVHVGKSLENDYAVGDIVVDGAFGWPWADRAVVHPKSPDVYLAKIPPALDFVASPTSTLSVIGQPGLTAYFGIERFAKPSWRHNCSFQRRWGRRHRGLPLAKRRGCKVVGLTSTDDKAAFLAQK